MLILSLSLALDTVGRGHSRGSHPQVKNDSANIEINSISDSSADTPMIANDSQETSTEKRDYDFESENHSHFDERDEKNPV